MSKGKFTLGAIIGTVIGVITGVLTAPKSGKETREDLKKKADELKTTANTQTEKARAKAEGVVGEVRSNAENLVERAGHAVDGAKKGFNSKK